MLALDGRHDGLGKLHVAISVLPDPQIVTLINAVLVSCLSLLHPIELTVGSLKWVESNPDENGFGGGAGADWVDEHIESWINVAGSILGELESALAPGGADHAGVAKAMTAFLSGEMRDTVEIVSLRE